ncbi:MAG: hypothetical protein ACLQDY_28555 [Streptosporangiaceae bacterium]
MYTWELDGPALHEFAALPQPVRAELTRFLDAVVIADPVGYQRHPDEPGDRPAPLRMLTFGPHAEGLVTFLIYPFQQPARGIAA